MARLDLSRIASKINTIHNQRFTQNVIETLEYSAENPLLLWKLICGGNAFIDGTFKHTYTIKDINAHKYEFYKCLMSKIHLWVWAIHDIVDNNAPPNRYTCKYNIIPEDNVFHHIRNDTYYEWLTYRHKLRDTDLIFATDSSSKDKLTGIGLCCVNLNNLYKMHQPVGNATNNYGELFAIYCCSDYIRTRNINTSNRRVIIFTDSLYNFLPLLTAPVNFQKKISYPILYKQTQDFLIKHKVIL